MAKRERKRYVVTHDGMFSGVELSTAEDAVPFAVAKKQLLKYLRSRRNDFALAVSDARRLTEDKVE